MILYKKKSYVMILVYPMGKKLKMRNFIFVRKFKCGVCNFSQPVEAHDFASYKQ